MKIIYTEGSSFLVENRTGVGNYHYEIIKRINSKVDIEVKLFNFKNKLKMNIEEDWLLEKIEVNYKYKLILACLLPYKYFFKTSEKSLKIIDGYPFCVGGKKIGIVHDLMSLEHPENYTLLSKCIIYLFFLKARKFNKIITVSETTKRKIVNLLKISEEKIEVVSPGIDLLNFKKINKTNLEERFGIKTPYILYLGALRKNKNIDKIIELFYLYKKENTDQLNLVIAGKKNQEYINLKKLVEYYSLEKYVIFTDYITEDEKKELYKNSSAFLLFSSNEGFGIPIIEAMAFGIPILASNIEVFKEILGEEIKLFDPNRTQDSLMELQKILSNNDYRIRLKKIYLERVKKYDIKVLAEKFLKVLSEV